MIRTLDVFQFFKRFSIAISLMLSSLPLSAQAPAPDVILHNAVVLTMDRASSTAEAVAITGNHITTVGKSDDLLKLAGPNTVKVDLKGRTLMPGLMDTHINNWNDPGP